MTLMNVLATDIYIGKPLPSPTLKDLTLWLLGRRVRLRVVGDSMQPTLQAGDLVFINPRAYGIGSPPQVGEIVVAYHPCRKHLLIIKRIAAIAPDQLLLLHSDNPQAGSDSRQFGAIAPAAVLGRVACRIPR